MIRHEKGNLKKNLGKQAKKKTRKKLLCVKKNLKVKTCQREKKYLIKE